MKTSGRTGVHQEDHECKGPGEGIKMIKMASMNSGYEGVGGGAATTMTAGQNM